MQHHNEQEGRTMQSYTLETDQADYDFEGVTLGASTSQRGFHNHEEDFLPAVMHSLESNARRRKCSACRWFEVRIFRTDGGKFVAHTVGRSIVPGETDYSKVIFTDSATDLIDKLTVRGVAEPFLPAPALRALEQAADKDEKINQALDDREVPVVEIR
jgi:hypothetical protein